jgi:hypothetical protein
MEPSQQIKYLGQRVCDYCHLHFVPTRNTQRFCCRRHKEKMFDKEHPGYHKKHCDDFIKKFGTFWNYLKYLHPENPNIYWNRWYQKRKRGKGREND